MKTLKLTDDELDNLASALSFTIRERERVTKDKAPKFKRSLEKLSDKIWKAIRSKK